MVVSFNGNYTEEEANVAEFGRMYKKGIHVLAGEHSGPVVRKNIQKVAPVTVVKGTGKQL